LHFRFRTFKEFPELYAAKQEVASCRCLSSPYIFMFQ
jgi:hypothetical protein